MAAALNRTSEIVPAAEPVRRYVNRVVHFRARLDQQADEAAVREAGRRLGLDEEEAAVISAASLSDVEGALAAGRALAKLGGAERVAV